MSKPETTETLETNLEIIAALAEPHWADNWNFRAYLQRHVKPAEIDRVAQELNNQVSAGIDCTTCGNCCREVYPHMTPQDVSRLASGMGVSEDILLAKTTREENDAVVFCERPCPMLEGNRCTVYQYRPADCRDYPHLDKPDFLGGSVGTIENYGTCPIVFNVFKRMKTSFNYDPSVDYIGDDDPEAFHGSLFEG